MLKLKKQLQGYSKFLSASVLILGQATNGFANTQNQTQELDLQEKRRCEARGQLYVGKNICVDVSAEAQVYAALLNQFRDSGGNEVSLGDTVIEGRVSAARLLDRETLKAVAIEISVVPNEMVNHYLEKAEQNQHNNSRLRSDGLVDRPWILGSISGELEYSKMQKGKISVGAQEISGLKPLEGKPSQYYMTAPYGLIVRYDNSIKYQHSLNNEIKKIVDMSFGLNDGDGVKGQSSVKADDSRSNSYPSYFGNVHFDIAQTMRLIGEKLGDKLKGYSLYVGVSAAYGDTGSHKGQKRRQDDVIGYVGFSSEIGGGAEFEVRVFQAQYARNKKDDGDGRHSEAVESEASGVEVAVRKVGTFFCNETDFYGNYHQFESEGEDGEFTFGEMRELKGYMAGVRCQNMAGVEGLSMGFEGGELKIDNHKGNNAGTWARMNGKTPGLQFNLNVTYKFSLNQLR